MRGRGHGSDVLPTRRDLYPLSIAGGQSANIYGRPVESRQAFTMEAQRYSRCGSPDMEERVDDVCTKGGERSSGAIAGRLVICCYADCIIIVRKARGGG